MASKSLFRGAARSAPPTTSLNHAHAPAYGLDSRAALAQLAATGCFGQTYYVSGREQLDELLGHAAACDPAYAEGRSGWGGTALMEEWMTLKRRNPAAKLVCIDLTPNVHAR